MGVEPVRTALEPQVRAAINSVTDPCSVGQAFPIGLVDMGMLTALDIVEEVDGGARVTVHLRTTFPGCTFVFFFEEALKTTLAGVPGVTRVSVIWEASLDWSADDMSPQVKARLAMRRQQLAAAGASKPPRM